MHSPLLLPNRFKTIGWLILLPATIAGIYITASGFEPSWLNARVFALFNDEFIGKNKGSGFIEANLTNTVVGILFIAGAMLVSFSRERSEDEYIARLRLSSLLWAVCVNYILLFFAFILVYGTPFLTVMIYNMFTVLIIFIIRFNYILYKNSKTLLREK